MSKDKKETRKEELVENYISKLISHIDSKSSDAVIEASMAEDGFDSMAGMGSISSEESLAKSVRMMFGIIPYEEDND